MSHFCPNCGKELPDDAGFCVSCGHKVAEPVVITKLAEPEKVNVINKFANKVDELAGGEGKPELRFKDLFTEVFNKHSSEEAEELFICGTYKTTPAEADISSEWPKPWLFSRVFVVLLITYGILYTMLNMFENINAIPGVIFIGSLAAPFSTLIFFYEVNAPRNISIFSVVRIFFIGGCLSMIITLFLYTFEGNQNMAIFEAIFIGVVEEAGKILATALFIKNTKKCKYILNGMLIGAAVGTGFAVFESAGYALKLLLASQSFSRMYETILIRGVLSPGGHVAWAAIEGAALMISLHGADFTWDKLLDKQFLSLSLICVVLHAIWDMPLFGGIFTYPKLGTLIVSAWIVLIVLINRGLKEINKKIQLN